jgi:hypothetical protein
MKKLTLTTLLFLIPFVVLAQTPPTSSLTPFLFANNGGATDLENLINNLYALSIVLAALLAVIKIIIGGVKWMLSDIVTTKQDAKKEIWTALIGLLIVISAVLVLNVINPQTATINLQLNKLTTSTLPNPSNTGPQVQTQNCASPTCAAEMADCELAGGLFPDGGEVTEENFNTPPTPSTIECTEIIPDPPELEVDEINCGNFDCMTEQVNCLTKGGYYENGGRVVDMIMPDWLGDNEFDCAERPEDPNPATLEIYLSCDGLSCDDAAAACFNDWDSPNFVQVVAPTDTTDEDDYGNGVCTFVE